ncbi:MAG: hypothetical protein VKJ06_08990 [Vampirovibrionales bacterium]|nr:hypothetical protein [Vampirovibrionales bacterium]
MRSFWSAKICLPPDARYQDVLLSLSDFQTRNRGHYSQIKITLDGSVFLVPPLKSKAGKYFLKKAIAGFSQVFVQRTQSPPQCLLPDFRVSKPFEIKG